MSHDPVLNAISLLVYRAVIFLSTALMLTVILWVWLILGWLDQPIADLPAYTAAAFAPDDNLATSIVAGMCAVIASLIMTVVCLLADKWYRRPAAIRLRGSRLVDARGWRRRW
ncbi:hypothetical protein [Povalibacter sp.]|uniref:hypothetical protein n=1 Tax=Povalibacter sp. TaxID=1962978 RepID=UPI002F3F7FC3